MLFPGCYSIGSLKKTMLSLHQLALLNEVIPGAAVNVKEAYTFKKICFQKQTFYSMVYTKVRKRNSYTASYVSRDGTLAVGCIVNFVTVVLANNDNPYWMVAVQELQATPNHDLFTGIDTTGVQNVEQLGGHLKPYSYNR